ncbi:MAG: hypothetical protein QG656_2465, partial [Candidatus Hydrogenedentes bacterium]|nr:hypothetical protein [Candidatus Hydrogenedentota bacterium]
INPGFVDSEIRFLDNEGRFHADRKDPAPEWLVCPADKAARQIVRGMYKHKFEVIITRHGRLMAWFGRHFPRACRFLMRAIAARQIDRGEAAKR